MRNINISDVTIREAGRQEMRVTFKNKLEIAQILDKLCVDVIALGEIRSPRADSLLIKSIAAQTSFSTVSVTCGPDENDIRAAWDALKDAKRPSLEISVPLSTARLEYVTHKKTNALLPLVKQSVSLAASLTEDVVFEADDATRADGELLMPLLQAAVEAGARTLCLNDRAGLWLPEEAGEAVKRVRDAFPCESGIRINVGVSDELGLADACAAAAIAAGADGVSAACGAFNTAHLTHIAKILTGRQEKLMAGTGIRVTEINRAVDEIARCLATEDRASVRNASAAVKADEETFNAASSLDDVVRAVSVLGYDLTDSDRMRVWNAFTRIAARKAIVSVQELEVIVASEAMQVPSAYTLESYVVTTGNAMDIVAHVKLRRNGKLLDGLSLGDGPIDAAFLAIEKITGNHYELDDFQLQSITEGREAMGQTVVRLRSEGRLYSGHGLSTDIIGSGIEAYLSALNKIVFEEENP